MPLLVSGAGHDALAMAELTPIGMLFVRCRHGGISHSPEARSPSLSVQFGYRPWPLCTPAISLLADVDAFWLSLLPA